MSEHRRFAPSSMYRLFECPGSLNLIESLPPPERESGDSVWARRGTCGHMFDEQLLAAIVDYVQYCQRLIPKSDVWHPEKNLSLEGWKPLEQHGIDGDEVGGTMDFISIVERNGLLEIVDLKTGKGTVVEVSDNPQLMTYALCALLAYHRKHKIRKVKITIGQSAVDHIDGPIRSETYTAKELVEWGKETLIPKILASQDPTAPRIPGEHQCQYCPGKSHCKEAYDYVLDAAMIEFDGVIEPDNLEEEVPIRLPDTEVLTRAQSKLLIDHGDQIIDLIHAVKAKEHAKAEQGDILPGYKLVRKRANRRYCQAEQDVKKALNKLGLHPADYNTAPALKTPSQVETILRGKAISVDAIQTFLNNNVETPENGTNFVKLSAPGAPVRPAIEAEFAHLIDNDDDDDLLEW